MVSLFYNFSQPLEHQKFLQRQSIVAFLENHAKVVGPVGAIENAEHQRKEIGGSAVKVGLELVQSHLKKFKS